MKHETLDKHAKAYMEASVYDIENSLTFEWYADRIVSLAPTCALLELGIGHGVTTRKFSASYFRHVIIEGSEEVIRSFRQKYSPPANVEIIHCFFEEYDGTDLFDVIVMGFVLEHVDDPGAVLTRFRRFLKPDGRLYVTAPNAKSLHRRIGYEAGLLKDIYEFNDYDRAAGHKRYFDYETIKNTVENAGYVVTRSEGLFLKPITTRQMNALCFTADIMKALLKIGMEYPELCNSVLLEAAVANSGKEKNIGRP
jgi:ubiquinone/menaquinone biosynthesis C-methylase UbiE